MSATCFHSSDYPIQIWQWVDKQFAWLTFKLKASGLDGTYIAQIAFIRLMLMLS